MWAYLGALHTTACECIAASKTIQDNLGGGTITETAKESKDGKTYYEAEVKKPGGEKVEIKVAEDGKLINVGQEEDEDE